MKSAFGGVHYEICIATSSLIIERKRGFGAVSDTKWRPLPSFPGVGTHWWYFFQTSLMPLFVFVKLHIYCPWVTVWVWKFRDNLSDPVLFFFQVDHRAQAIKHGDRTFCPRAFSRDPPISDSQSRACLLVHPVSLHLLCDYLFSVGGPWKQSTSKLQKQEP